jgi:hypothetical protein
MANVIIGMMAMGVIFVYMTILKAVGLSREEVAVCVVPFAISFLGMVFTFIYFKG